MDSVTIDTARALVRTHAVNRAIIQCIDDGRRWTIIFRGQAEFILKSQRQNPKSFVKLETALAEIHALGLRHAEIDFTKWKTA
jgi:hypothetical protein